MILNPALKPAADRLAAEFHERNPFRHVVIDDFFTPEYCAQLLAQFPPFERGNARNEAGKPGNKSTIEKIRDLGPAFATLDDLVQSRDFLDLIGRITGIDDLLYDPWYFGGGTHENRNGQDLDAHVDFNRHPVERWHRRLNLIVYLNHEWDLAWGGALELHSDPRAADDRVISIAPLFNRAVIFETTEVSWHAFPRIALPADKQALTRKSVALYFYTKERPADELADTHSTIYVDLPLPERFVPGRTLDVADVEDLRVLLTRRDQHNLRLHRSLTSLAKQLEQAQAALADGGIGKVLYFAGRFAMRLGNTNSGWAAPALTRVGTKARNIWDRVVRLAKPLAPGIAVILFGVFALKRGQANSWDLRNYHLYDGWAFWTGRATLDFAVAQLQTYFNPLLASATYLLFVGTAPRVSAFLLGAVQGANFVPLFFLARRLLPAGTTRSFWFVLFVALTGAVGATQLGELGGSMGDNLVSLPILTAYAMVFGRSAVGARRAALAGLLLGFAVGLKLTCAPFAFGLLIALLPLTWNTPQRWSVPVAASVLAALAFFASDGFWLWHLYREFGNPLHPMFASLFGGPFASLVPLRDVHSLPQSIWDWLIYPLIWLKSPHRVSELWFRDLRVPLAFIALPLLLWRGSGDVDTRDRVRALSLALAIAYVAWLALFSIYRYVAPIEMLAPLLIVLALGSFAPRRLALVAGVLLAAMVAFTHSPNWGHLRHYGHRFVQVDVPALPGLDRATVVLAENEPLAFLALGFPPTTSFLRIAGNMMGPPYPPYGMDREAARRLAAAQGPIYALLLDPQSAATQAALERQHLELDADACARVRSNLLANDEAVQLCPLHLAATARATTRIGKD